MEQRKATKRLSASRELRDIIAEYYRRGNEAKGQGRLVGWLPPMNGAIEVCYAMDIHPVFPENWSPVCAATGLAPRCIEAAERRGYSRDLCGYLRNGLGYVFEEMKKEDQPLGGLPEPDFLFAFGAACVPSMKTFQEYTRHFRVPVFTADMPQVRMNDIGRHHMDFALSEQKKLIAFLEDLSGRKLDMDRLRETVALSDRACELWDEMMEYRSCVPTPFSAAEIGMMFVMVVLPGTQTAVDFLTKTRDEIKERADNGIGVIPEERYRLYWDNIPLWYNMGLFNRFERYGAVVVAETYSAAWSIRLDAGKPLESLARKSLTSFALVSGISLQKRIDLALSACRRYKIDGAILHSNMSCKPISTGQMDLKRALAEDLDIPSIVFEADHMDVRSYNEAQVEARIDGFMDLLAQKKRV